MQSSTAENQEQPIMAKMASSNAERARIMPDLFPQCFIEVETTTFSVADRISKNYNGGYWEFYRLTNGGFFMAPSVTDRMQVSIPFGNDFSGEMSAEAFGITVTLFTYCFLAEKFPNSSLADHYSKLYEFMTEHAEASTIWQAID
ncbi:antirestriction protein [Gilvimarinus polysaccharolyticus]|uniref:antirestriction protein n=1 Tax=Gilvimarinus polysaccharolyticus TaxID=863921 RepID=UPI0006735784|nr:antirestriction protein [Gilvimarinus polysaccharolyticus]